jgi:hypothetical protein
MSSNIYTNTTPTRTALDNNMKYINTEIRIIDGISKKKKKKKQTTCEFRKSGMQQQCDLPRSYNIF